MVAAADWWRVSKTDCHMYVYQRLTIAGSISVIQVKLQSKTVKVVNTYHAPNKTVMNDQYRRLFQTFNRDAIILGDLNAYSTFTSGGVIAERVNTVETRHKHHAAFASDFRIRAHSSAPELLSVLKTSYM